MLTLALPAFLGDEITKWWDPAHTSDEESKCLSLEDGRSVRGFEIIYVEKARLGANVEEP